MPAWSPSLLPALAWLVGLLLLYAGHDAANTGADWAASPLRYWTYMAFAIASGCAVTFGAVAANDGTLRARLHRGALISTALASILFIAPALVLAQPETRLRAEVAEALDHVGLLGLFTWTYFFAPAVAVALGAALGASIAPATNERARRRRLWPFVGHAGVLVVAGAVLWVASRHIPSYNSRFPLGPQRADLWLHGSLTAGAGLLLVAGTALFRDSDEWAARSPARFVPRAAATVPALAAAAVFFLAWLPHPPNDVWADAVEAARLSRVLDIPPGAVSFVTGALIGTSLFLSRSQGLTGRSRRLTAGR